MTIETLICEDSYVADGTTNPRSIGFPIADPSYLSIEVDGVLQTLGTHYLIDGDYAAGAGRIVPQVAWASGAAVDYFRVTRLMQAAAIPAGKPLPSRSLEAQLDRDVMRIQEIGGELSRVPTIPRRGGVSGKFPVVNADDDWSWASGTGADDGLRTDLAEGDGPLLLGFQQSGDPDATKFSLLLKLSQFVAIKDYLKGGDDTDAVQKAMERATANGVDCRADNREHVIGGTLYNPGCTLRGEGKNSLFQKVGVGMLFTNEYTAPVRAGYYLTDSPLFSRTVTLQNIAHAAMFTVGHWAIIASQAFYDTPNLAPNKKAEFVRIVDIIGATIVLDGPVMDSYPIGDQPELIPVTLATGVAYNNISCAMDLTVAPVPGGDAATELRHIITTKWALEPQFGRIWMKNSIGAGIALQGTIQGSIDGLRGRNFGSADLPDGTRADGGLGGYGYLLSLRGMSFGLVVSDIGSLSVRHTVTDAPDYDVKLGRPVETTISKGTSLYAKLSGFDAHQLGYGLKLSELSSVGSLGPGFTLRNDAGQMTDCRAINNLGSAIALYKGSSENAEAWLIDGIYADGNNWGQSTQENGDIIDWRYKGTFLDMGTNNTIRNFLVPSCYGPLYETAPNTVNPTLEHGQAWNINKGGLANRAFWFRATGATRHRLKDIDIDVTGAGIANLVRNDSADFGNIPHIQDMRITGTISGVQYSSALANNQFVHWTGPGYEGFNQAIALGGATSIDLNGRIGTVFTITRTASEVLSSILGRAVEGAKIRLFAGVGGFYLQHGTAADNIFLSGAPAGVSLTEGQSILLQRRGTIWRQIEPVM